MTIRIKKVLTIKVSSLISKYYFSLNRAEPFSRKCATDIIHSDIWLKEAANTSLLNWANSFRLQISLLKGFVNFSMNVSGLN